jgi:hypothetical protein
VTERSYVAKLTRAETLLRSLNACVNNWQRDGYRIAEDRDVKLHPSQPLFYVNGRVYVETLAPIDPAIPLLLGEWAHNTRSALNHLTYDLVMHSVRGPLTKEATLALEFPILDWSPTRGSTSWNGRIGLASRDARVLIGDAQPYTRRHEYASHPLHLLREISNTDKHRHHPVMRASSEITTLHLDGTLYHDISFTHGHRLEVGSDLMTYLIMAPPDYENKLKDGLSLDVVFGYGSPRERKPIIPALREIQSCVKELATSLDELLPA